MSKKILFMSSAKLTALSIGLLLAVFCTIGMSFTPADEGGNVGNPNDSTYVTGPRRNHYTESGCLGDTQHNQLHYGQATATTTGNGKVYASNSGSGQAGSSWSGTASGNSSSVKLNCGMSDDNAHTNEEVASAHNVTAYLYAEANDGYYFKGWSSSNAPTYTEVSTSLPYSYSFKIGGDSYEWKWGNKESGYTENNPYNASSRYAFFSPVQVTEIDNATMTINPTDPRTTCEDYADNFAFTTSDADAMVDFVDSEVKQISQTGNGTFDMTTTPDFGNNKVKVAWQFKGSGTYGGTTNPRNRQNSVTYKLTSKGDASSYKTCTITANFPNLSMSGEDVEVYTTYVATEPSAGTAVITVNYADDANDFVTAPASVALSNITGDAGAWSLGTITMSETNYATGIATIEIPYTFTPVGDNKTGTVTADYVLTADDAVGGAVFTLHFTAEVAQPDENEASVTIGGITTKYEHLLGVGGALEAANGATGATLKLLKDVEVNESVVIRKAMTFDLNSFTLTSSLSSTATKAIEITNGVSVILCTSRAGGKIVASGNYNGRLSGVEVTNGLLTYNSGSVQISNAHTGTTEANRYAVGVYLATGGMIMTNGSITASRIGASGNYVYGIFCADGTAVDITGGTITAANPNGGYAYGIWLQGQSPLNNVTVTATAKDHAYGVWTQSGEIVVEGGTYMATTTATTHARAFLCRGEVNILGGSFTATAATNNAAAIYTCGGAVTIGGGAYIANAANTAYSIEMYSSGDEVKVNGGTFTATAATSNAAGVWVNNGTSLTTTKGTFTATAEGAGTDIRAYGAYVVAGGSADIKGSTFRGITTGATTAKATTNCNNVSGDVYYGAYGICNHGALSIANSALYGTSTKVYGYGLYTTFGTTINNSTITATAGTDRSVALYPNGSGKIVTLTDCIVTGSSEGVYSYAVYSLGGILNATNTNFTGETKQTGASAAAASYSRGIYGNSSTTISLTGGTVTAKGSASYSQSAYAFFVAGPGTIEGTTVITENVNSGHALYADGSSARLTVINGHFKGVTASLNVKNSPTVSLRGGFYSHNTGITEACMPAGYQVFSVPDGSVEKTNGYNYSIGTPDNPGYAVCRIVNASGTTLKEYNTLAEALQAVTANQTIVMTANYTLPAGNYTLPTNTKLLVPREAAQTALETNYSSIVQYDKWSNPSAFRTLTFASGARLVANGDIQVASLITSQGQTGGKNGAPYGPHGKIVLQENSQIVLENGANLYAWGYVTGSGMIEAKKGSTAYESMQIRDWRGGTATSKIYDKVFPFNQYFIQNIESRIRFRPGAVEKCSGTVNASSSAYTVNTTLIGTSDALFLMDNADASEGTWVQKSYDFSRDYQVYEVNSAAQLSNLVVSGLPIVGTINSGNYALPLVNNMHIHLLSGELEVIQDVLLQPGVIIEIDKEAKCVMRSGKSMYLQDSEDSQTYNNGGYFYLVQYSPQGSVSGKRAVQDASINMHGTFEFNGYLYTSEHGASVISTNEDAGTIIFKNSSPSDKNLYICNTGSTVVTKTFTTPQLRNADGETPAFTSTSGSVANDEYAYYLNQWRKWVSSGCFTIDKTDGSNWKYYAKPAEYVQLLSNTEDENHLYHDAATEVRAFLVDEDCQWWEVESVPYDGNKYKCVNPDHNGKYKYYEYVSGWQEAVVSITWKNGSSTLATYNNSLYGSRPKYLSATPTKTAGSYVQYSWDGWLTETDKSHETDIAPVDNSWRVLDNNEMPVATTATTYYAHYTVNPKQYYIKFYSESGSVILQQSAQNAATSEAPTVGLRPVYGGTTPTKDPTAAKEYIFYGWSTAANGGGIKYAADNLPVMTAVANYYACFTEQAREYTISFVNYNGDVLKTSKVAYGTTPTAPTGEYAPTRANDAFWSYDFIGWDKAIRGVDGDETYTAQYARTALVPKYTIRFLNWDGSVLYRATVEEGQTPVYAGVTPTREATGYTYTFSGWGTITAATADKDYTAQYDVVAEQFYITFMDEDGRQRERKLVDYNTMPEYTGSTLTKDQTEAETFVFDHWSPALAKVTGEATYTAVYAASPRKYTITFWNYNHTSQLQSTEVAYGTTPTYSGGAPTKPSDTYYSYIFENWMPAITAVTGNQSYVPYFSQTALGQTITFLNADGSALYEQDIPTDQPIVYNGPTPLKAADASYIYVHDGWSTTQGGAKLESLPTVSGSATYYAHYSTTPTVASVTVGGSTTYYANIDAAFTAANASATYEPTITLLRDASTTTTTFISYTGARNCTLNLNGHTLSSTTAQALLYINMEGITFTITDLTESKSGTLHLESTSTDNRWCVYVAKGNLQMDAGSVFLHSKADQFNEGIRIDPAASTFTMNGGKVHVVTSDGKPACGIVSRGIAFIRGGEIQVEASGIGYGIEARVSGDNIGNVTVYGGKFLVTGTTAACAYRSNANATLKLQGGYYNTNTNLEANCATNYHVLSLTGEDPYKYEVAEAYTLTWDLDGGTVTTAGTGAAVDATGAPNTIVKAGASITAPVVTKTGFTFAGWSDGSSVVTPVTTMPAANTTYTATWAASIADRELDIVDWTSNSVTINANGLKTEGGTTDWKIYVVGKEGKNDYVKGDRDASRTLTIDNLALTSGNTISIQMKRGDGTVESQHHYKIPYINTATGAGAEDIVYVNSEKLTINASTTLAALYVGPEASVEITNGTLTVDKLVLRTLPWQAASISGNFTATNVYYTRIAPNLSTQDGLSGTYTYKSANYYPFALPISCDINDVFLSEGTNMASTYGSAWSLKQYNEMTRAQNGENGENWNVVNKSDNPELPEIVGGKGYLFYSNTNYYREFYFPVNLNKKTTSVVVSYTTEDTQGASQQGWNMIGSPLMENHDANPQPENPILCWLDENNDYQQMMPDEIKPALPFFYQASSGSSLCFEGCSDNNPSLAPRRVAASEEQTRIQWVHLDIKDANGIGDQTSIYAHPTRYEERYQTGIDVAKQSLTASRARIYSSHAYGDMAFTGVADSQLEQGVPLTVYSPSAQELTFSLRDNDWLNRMEYVWLIDKEEGMRIDLLNGYYTFNASEGTTRGRFFIQGQFKAPNITTELEPTSDSSLKGREIRKVIINQKMFIEVNGRLYDATGKEVKR